MNTGAGIIVGVILGAALPLLGVSAPYTVYTEIVVLSFVILESGYGVFRQERNMRSELEAKVRLIARPASYALNTRNPAPSEIDLLADISFEIWTDIDIDTSELVLNIIGTRPLWKVWRIGQDRNIKLIGIRPRGQDTPIYRKRIRATDEQPFEDSVRFAFQGDFAWRGSFGLELVLTTGRPKGKWRDIVDSRLHERGSLTPA